MVISNDRDRACPATGKLRYQTEDALNRAIDNARKGRELRGFRCKKCFGWHVTRIKQGDKHALERSQRESG